MSDKLATLKAKNSISFKALESGETEVSFVVDKLNYGEKARIKTALEERRHADSSGKQIQKKKKPVGKRLPLGAYRQAFQKAEYKQGRDLLGVHKAHGHLPKR